MKKKKDFCSFLFALLILAMQTTALAGVEGTICALDSDLGKVGLTVAGTTATVAKLFNVSSGVYSEGWEKGTGVQVAFVSENYLTYTNANGDAYPGGGRMTAIDNANITLKVGGSDVAYTAANYGTFTLSSANTDTIIWDGNVTAAIGHNSLEFTIPFTATSNDANAFTDTNSFTFIVTPQNLAPVLSNFVVIKAEEDEQLEFSVKVVELDGDDFDLPNSLDITIGDTTYEGVRGSWTNEGDVFTFTTTQKLSFDVVTHTASATNVLESVGGSKCFYASWSVYLFAYDSLNAVSQHLEAGSTAGRFNTWIKDKDRAQSRPTFTKYEPASPTTNDNITVVYGLATDEDGDRIEYRVEWACGSMGYVGGKKTGSTYKMKAMGAEDPDGDDVNYVYSLYVDGTIAETSAATAPGTEFTTTTAMAKGQKAELKAKAVSTYGVEQKESAEYTTGELPEIENSAPVITTSTDDVKVTVDEYVEGYNEAAIELTIGADGDVKFAYSDIDENAGVDTVSLTVDDTGLAGYATATIIDGKLVITRELNGNTVGLADDARPSFTITATDESGEAVGTIIYLTVNPINTKPDVEVSDISVNLDTPEFEELFPVTSFGASEDEADQTIAAFVDAAVEDESGLLEGYEIIASEDGKSIIVKGRVNQDAAPESEATIKFKVMDNGGMPYQDTSDEISFKIVVVKASYSITIDGTVYDGLNIGDEKTFFAAGVHDGVKFDKWETTGIELEDNDSPVISVTISNSDIALTSSYTELGFKEPADWNAPTSRENAMVVSGFVSLPSGYSFNDDNTLVGVFDDEGNCRGVGAPNAHLSSMFDYGCSIYYLVVSDGVQTEGLTLKFWNRLTNEILNINETIDFEAGVIDIEEPRSWTTEYNLNDASNPDSPYYNEYIYGEDVEGTVFSMVLTAAWENSPIGYDYKLRLHNSATANFDRDYDTMQPPLVPPFNYDENAYFVSDDKAQLQVDSRPVVERNVSWKMKVVVPKDKPAIISWDGSTIPAGWDVSVRLFNNDGEEIEEPNVSFSGWCASEARGYCVIDEPGVWYLVFDFFDSNGLVVFNYELVPGWNLITPTLNLLDESIDELLALKVYVLDEENIFYINATRSDIVPGRAIWLFCDDYYDLDVWGTSIPDDGWELAVGSDWGLVGIVQTIDAEDVPEDIFVWEWTSGGYRSIKGSLEAGKAYWMYSIAE